jgi:superkiller protein 3
MALSYEAYLKQGDGFANQGKLTEALQQYIEARNLDPGRPEAHKQIINLALKKEDFTTALQEYLDWSAFLQTKSRLDEALKVLQEAVSLEAQRERRGFLDRKSASANKLKEHFTKFAPQFYEKLGEIYYEKKDYDNAIQYLDKAVSIVPNSTKSYALLGLSYMAKGLLDRAKGPFQEVVRFKGPETALAYEKLADIYASQGNTTQMIIWLDDAAKEYVSQGDLQKAIMALERILEAEPSNKEILGELADLYAQVGDRESAIRVYKQLAEIYSQSGLFDKVIVLYEKLVEWEPENLEIVDKLLEIYRMSLEVDPANLRARIKLIENLLRKGENNQAVGEYLKLLDSYIKIGLLDEAISCCKSILELDPSNVTARETLADLYAKTGKAQEAGHEIVSLVEDLKQKGEENKAAEVIQKAVTFVPETGNLHLKLAQDFLAKGENDSALEEFQKVLEENPNDLEALWNVGKLLFDRQQYESAKGFLERLLAIEPKHFEARQRLVEVYEAELLREMEEFSSIAV